MRKQNYQSLWMCRSISGFTVVFHVQKCSSMITVTFISLLENEYLSCYRCFTWILRLLSLQVDCFLYSCGRFSWYYGENLMDSVDQVGMNGDLRNVISLHECGRTFYLIIGVSHQFCDLVAQPLHSLASLQTWMLLCFWICKWGDFHSLLLRKFTTGLQGS